MNKNSFLQSKVLRSNVAQFAVVAMITGFFLSRAVLSMAIMLFGLNGLAGIHPRRWLKEKWWLLGVSWVGMYFLSALWSTDLDYWHTRCEVKLPILLLPLAFAYTAPFSYKQQKIVTLVLNLMVLCGVCYSFSFLLIDAEHYIKGYDYSNVLPTIPKNDHIVFSLAVATTIVWNIYFLPYVRDRWLKRLLVIFIIILIASLHGLAVRTGLVAFYVFITGWSIYLSLRRHTRTAGILLLISFMLAATMAISYIPTLRNRLNHTRYTLQMFREGNMSGDYSDIGRYMSYDISLRLIRQHPFSGVGAGNMLDSMKRGYSQWYPQVPEEQQLIPHNQFLTVALGCGIPAMLLFLCWVLYPLKEIKKNRQGFFCLIVWCMMLVPLLVEPLLEIQFGVFVYLFFLLWQRHVMLKPQQGEA